MKDVVKIPQSKTVARMDGKRVFGLLKPDSWPIERISAGSIAVDMASFISTNISSKKAFIEGVTMEKQSISLIYTAFTFLTVRVPLRIGHKAKCVICAM